MSRKSTLLPAAVLEKVKKAGAADLKQMVIDAMQEARKYKGQMKEDQQIKNLKEDLSALQGGYKDQIKACELVADLALARIEFLEDLEK